ncbi:MAG: glycosyltransferase [Halioglobus sp.]
MSAQTTSCATASAVKIKVLFFCEAVTLAHVARPATLARSLDRTRYEVHMAQHPRYRALVGDMDVVHHDLESIEPKQFMQALAEGAPVYEEETLCAYVEQDRALIQDVKPDIVVGDFRISLQVSARLAGVPYITITNAYWSEFCKQAYTVPDLPFTRLLGYKIGQGIFTLARPVAFALHCRPMNSVRKRYGLPSIGHSLQRIYTEADYTLYADTAETFNMGELPGTHGFMGPLLWSPVFPRPSWWESFDRGRPSIYVTLGSSGQSSTLPVILNALASLDANVLVSTAGGELPVKAPPNAFLAEYLSGDEAASVASLVICNGGSPTTQQALDRGLPVLGLAGNLDQFLNMNMVERTGAGLCLRAAKTTEKEIQYAVTRLLSDTAYHNAAANVATHFERYDPANYFRSILEKAA